MSEKMPSNSLYFDNNSTTRIDPRVASMLSEVLLEGHVNPASQHLLGQRSRRRLEDARTGCLRRLDADIRSFPADELIFTSGGTEANNLVILGSARRNQQLIVSAIEHPSVMLAAEHAAAVTGAKLSIVSATSSGVWRLDHLEELLREGPTSLVSLMLVNNETGVIQPVAEAAEICRQFGVLIHTDAVQGVGKIPVSFRELGVDYLTFAPHKFHGPRGIGGLVVRAGTKVPPLMHGGFQQSGFRPGTEDVVLAVACEHALDLAICELADSTLRWRHFRDLFLSELRDVLGDGFTENGASALCVPQTLNLSFPGVDRQALLIAADVAGMAVSTGSACSSGSSEPSPVLLAMGLELGLVESSIRISFGRDTTEEEIRRGSRQIGELVGVLRA